MTTMKDQAPPQVTPPAIAALADQVGKTIAQATGLLREGPLTPQRARLFAQLVRLGKGMLSALEEWACAEGASTAQR